MFEPAISDIVSPAITTDEPDALLHEIIGQGLQTPRLSRRKACQLALERDDSFPLSHDSRLTGLVCTEQLLGEVISDLGRHSLYKGASGSEVRIESEAKAQPDFGVAFKPR